MSDRMTQQDSQDQGNQDNTVPLKLGRLHYAWIVAATGSVAMFCGLGLGRFAFGMLLPSMSSSLGLNYTQSGILGFTNLIGYLVLERLRRQASSSLLSLCSVWLLPPVFQYFAHSMY